MNTPKYKLTAMAPAPASALDAQALEKDISYLRSWVCNPRGKKNSPFDPDKSKYISEQEGAQLCRALSRSSPDGSHTEQQAIRVWKWAQSVRVAVAVLNFVIKGWMSIKIRNDGELMFKALKPNEILADLESQRNGKEEVEDPGIAEEEADSDRQHHCGGTLDDEIAFLNSLVKAPAAEQGKPSRDLDTPLISKYEEVQLLRALSRTTPDGGFTENEAGRVWKWAEDTRVEEALLHSVLTGWINIKIRSDGELVFSAVDPKVMLAELENLRCEREDSDDPGIVEED